MLFGVLVAIAAIIILAIIAIVVSVLILRHNKKKSDESKIKIDSVKNVSVNPEDPLNPDIKVQTDEKETNETIPYKNLVSRFRAIAIFAAGCFSILGIKLFSMQVVNSDTYTKQSKANATTTIKTPAPRGNIFDSKGTVLVKNRSSLTVLAEGDVAGNYDVLLRLSVVLGIPCSVVRMRIEDQSMGAQSQRVVANDVSKKQAAYISEHAAAFDGITIQTRTIRDYPYGALAAHVLGYTGMASEVELNNFKEGRKLESEDIVGKSGIESSYDNILAGDHGEREIVSDADGNIVQLKSEIQPTKGSDVYLTLDASVQSLADKLLAETIAPDGVIGSGNGTAGSVVVMDINDGSILCLSNYPTFKPGIFTNGISQDTWNLYNTDSSYYPLLNRAIAGTYPAASTFKAFTGLAGLTYGYASTSSSWNCSGSWDGWKSGNVQKCWLSSGHGTLGFRYGIVQSCDVVFYEIGKQFFDNKKTIGDTAMQDEIKKYNFGKKTGIDLEGEESGRVPTPLWKAEYFKDIPTEATWLGGDTTNMAIGQGYVLITPIQLAVAYAAIASGKLVKPHLLKEIKNDEGMTVAKKDPDYLGVPDVNSKYVEIIKDALHGVATENSGVYPVFRSLGLDAACKTGTAEVAGKQDFAWTAAFAPYNNPKFVVSCIVEEGGGGSTGATPIAAKVLKAALDSSENKLEKKVEYIPGSTGKSRRVSRKSSSRTD